MNSQLWSPTASICPPALLFQDFFLLNMIVAAASVSPLLPPHSYVAISICPHNCNSAASALRLPAANFSEVSVFGPDEVDRSLLVTFSCWISPLLSGVCLSHAVFTNHVTWTYLALLTAPSLFSSPLGSASLNVVLRRLLSGICGLTYKVEAGAIFLVIFLVIFPLARRGSARERKTEKERGQSFILH